MYHPFEIPTVWRFTILVIVFALVSTRSTDAASPCNELQYGGPKYVVCTVDLRAYWVRLFWKDTNGQPYGGFDHLPRRIEGGPILFAMNGGMYESDRSPVGLYVEEGKTFKQANKASGVGQLLFEAKWHPLHRRPKGRNRHYRTLPFATTACRFRDPIRTHARH